MTKQELRQKLEQSLANFLETGDVSLLNWFIDMNNKYKSDLLNSEILITKFWSAFVRIGPHDVNIFNYLATVSPNIRITVSRLFSSLIETKDQNTYSTLLKIFEEKYKEWPSEIVTNIQNSCINAGLEIGPPNDTELLRVGLNTIRFLSDNQIAQISNTIVPRIASGDANIRNNVLQLLSLIKEKTNNEPIAIQECIDMAKQLLDANDQNAKFVLDYLFSYKDRINLTQINQIIALIQEQLSTSKPNPINSLGLDFAPQLIHNYNRHEILKDVIEFAKVVQEPTTKELCKQILVQFYRNLSTPQEKESKKLFGEDIFKK
jgi:hypothetical protein